MLFRNEIVHFKRVNHKPIPASKANLSLYIGVEPHSEYLLPHKHPVQHAVRIPPLYHLQGDAVHAGQVRMLLVLLLVEVVGVVGD